MTYAYVIVIYVTHIQIYNYCLFTWPWAAKRLVEGDFLSYYIYNKMSVSF